MMLALLASVLLSQDPPRPVPSDDRLVVELVAREPDIVTPTGIAVDAKGRIWAVENNTHMRPKNYTGHPSDRVRLFEDFGPDGRARKITTVVDGFEHGMNISIGPGGEAYLVTRNAIEVIGEKRRPIVRLETVGDYNHNGLFGMAFGPKGELTFAMGRNTGKDFPLGAPWTLVGTDGSKLSGTEGGRLFRCRADGSRLEQVALGFWNTYHMTYDAFGRLFAVDNDPGGGSECRLLHIVPGGDYGFRPRAGYREGHPFLSWTGEHPGTLPMVSFTGEAPAGILAYESDAIPNLRGALLVTSWGDHEVERFRPVARGASFTSRYDALLRGGEDFRPVGIAQAPDGSIVLSDWVDRSYPVHGKGRIWRVRPKTTRIEPEPSLNGSDPRERVHKLWAGADPSNFLGDAAEEVRGEAVRLLTTDDPHRLSIATTDASKYVRLQALLGMKPPSPLPEPLFAILEDPDPFLVGAAIAVLGRSGASEAILRKCSDGNPKVRIGALCALRKTGDKVDPSVIRAFLRDAEPSIRRAAIQWVGEDGLTDLAPDLAAAASQAPVSADVFEAYLGALEFLTPPAAGRRDSKSGEVHLVRILSDDAQPAVFRSYAIRMLRPDHPLFSLAKLEGWLGEKDETIRLEAARTLSTSIQEPAQELLRKLAGDRQASLPLRLEAAAGLAQSNASAFTRRVLLSLLEEENADLRFEAVRSLAGTAADPDVRRAFRGLLGGSKDRSDLADKAGLALKLSGDTVEILQPATNEEWTAIGREAGDAAAGERIFFNPRGPQCSLCHRVRGRGGEVGPDLSRVSRGMERSRVIESILEPSREIAPDFAAWEFITHEGDSAVGRILREDMDAVVLLGPSARPVSVKRSEIAVRRPSRVSMMPEGLQRGMTRKEFRDLVAFLTSLR